MAVSVLLVDDLSFMRTALKTILLDAGFSIAGEAENGKDGVILYKIKRPDIVLLDISMPVMDGITALQYIKKIDPASRVIMCSALGDQQLIIKAIQLGAADFIVKPFRPERIVSAIQKAL